MKKIIFILLVLLPGCVDEDFQETFENTSVNPGYSLPVGWVVYNLNEDFNWVPPDTFGIYGTIYYENRPFPNIDTVFDKPDMNDLNLRISDDIRDNIENITFHLVIKNSFPTEVRSNIYLLGSGGNKIDSLSDNDLIIPAGETDANGLVYKESITIKDISFSGERIDKLQNVAYYSSNSYIYTIKKGNKPVYFFRTSQLTISMGVRIKLKLNAKQLL